MRRILFAAVALGLLLLTIVLVGTLVLRGPPRAVRHHAGEQQGRAVVSGTVVDPEGSGLGGVVLDLCPHGVHPAVSDNAGRFSIRWNTHSSDPGAVLIARHVERGLAGLLEVDGSREGVTLELGPGFAVHGLVKDERGKPLRRAAVSVVVWHGSMGSSPSELRVDTGRAGAFELGPLPREGKFTLSISADGHGRGSWEFYGDEAAGNRVEAPDTVLREANKEIRGTVVDVDGEPVAGGRVYCYGNEQPHRETNTDAKGRFVLEGVCEGELSVSAHTKDGGYGNTRADGGETDVEVVIGERGGSVREPVKRPASLRGEPLPDLAGLGVAGLPGSPRADQLLVCFWDREQRPSRRCIAGLTSMVDELRRAGFTPVAIDLCDPLSDLPPRALPFASAQLKSSPELRETWGIRGLPWIIVTGADGVVTHDGVSLADVRAQVGAGKEE